MSIFEESFTEVVWAEGPFSKDPRDPGNWTGGKPGKGTLVGTKFGISAAAFPDLDIPNLTLEKARLIYKARYWDPLGLDTISQTSPLVARMLFNFGVNCGVSRAGRYLQTAINVLNFNENLNIPIDRLSPWQKSVVELLNGAPLKVDGVVGPITLRAFDLVPHKDALAAAVFGEGYLFYSKGKLIYRAGWLNRMARLFFG